MADNKMRLPSSGGGLLHYSESVKSKIHLTPKIVVALIIVITVVEILLYKLI